MLGQRRLSRFGYLNHMRYKLEDIVENCDEEEFLWLLLELYDDEFLGQIEVHLDFLTKSMVPFREIHENDLGIVWVEDKIPEEFQQIYLKGFNKGVRKSDGGPWTLMGYASACSATMEAIIACMASDFGGSERFQSVKRWIDLCDRIVAMKHRLDLAIKCVEEKLF